MSMNQKTRRAPLFVGLKSTHSSFQLGPRLEKPVEKPVAVAQNRTSPAPSSTNKLIMVMSPWTETNPIPMDRWTDGPWKTRH